MATVTQTAPAVTATETLRHHRFTVEQYHRMIDAGILKSGDRLELLDGWVVEKMPNNPPHASAIAALNHFFFRRLPEDWVIRTQLPVTLATSEPEPDLAVVRPPSDLYRQRHPGPADVYLLVEVADSSVATDRTLKFQLYALARIPLYWIVNIPDGRVEVYTLPRAGKNPTYRHRQDYGRDAEISLVVGGREVARLPARDLLPA